MCEKEWGDHRSFAAKAIESLFAVFKAWRCNIMYGGLDGAGTQEIYTLGKRTFQIRQTFLGLENNLE